jgi:hypothetical protein
MCKESFSFLAEDLNEPLKSENSRIEHSVRFFLFSCPGTETSPGSDNLFLSPKKIVNVLTNPGIGTIIGLEMRTNNAHFFSEGGKV